MQPCYLPDGGIAFISTRCQYGILCDGPDDFTTTVLYRMDADGRNLRQAEQQLRERGLARDAARRPASCTRAGNTSTRAR